MSWHVVTTLCDSLEIFEKFFRGMLCIDVDDATYLLYTKLIRLIRIFTACSFYQTFCIMFCVDYDISNKFLMSKMLMHL